MFYEVSGDKSNKQQEEYRKINNAYNEKLAKTNSPSVARKIMDERDKELKKYNLR